MKQTLHRLGVSLLVLTLCAGAAVAQKLAISSVSYPKAQASTSQPVRFQVHNYDFSNPFSGTATVGIKDAEGTVLCQKEVTLSIPKMGGQDVELPIRLHTDYGKKYAYTIFIDAEGNQSPAPNMDFSFTMPTTIGFPLEWSADLAGNSVQSFGNYNYFSEPDMFVAQGRVAVVNKGGVQSLPITFEKGKNMTVHFMHYSDLASTVRVLIDYGERIDTVYTKKCDASTQLNDHYCSFTADSTAYVRLVGNVEGSFNAYGQMQLGRLSVYESKPDLALTKIVAPAATSLSTSADGYEVTALITNASPFDIKDPELAFSFGTQKVSEQYEGTIKAFSTAEYTFKTRLKADANQKSVLNVSVTAADDANEDNNSIGEFVTIYAPQAFPYTTTFDKGNDLWTMYDGNNDGSFWAFESDDTFGNIVFFPSDAQASDDWLFSPAISMPEGRSRLSFYYTGGSRHTQHLRVLMGTEPTPDKMTEVLFDQDVKNNGWLNGYHVIDMAEAGVRYFAFQATGASDQIIIDNIKIDKEEDLCMADVAFEKKSGFGISSSKVKLSYVNHGVSTQKNITVRYWLNTANDPYTSTKAPYAEETVTDEVLPGDTLTYTFKKEADLALDNETYALVGGIVTAVGSDSQNDLIAGSANIENWALPTLPYAQGFEDMSTAQKQWTFVNHGTAKWLVGNNTASAYQGSKSLCHTGKVTEGEEDWAFSEPLTLEKGTYDISFFYRTTKNNKQATQAQNFRAMVGSAPEADKMTTLLLEEDNLLVPGQWAKKYTGTITVNEPTTVYLGFGSTTSKTQGMTFIDNICVSAHSDGKPLPFNLDLAAENAEEGIDKYYPSSTLCQWKLTDEADGSKAEVAERTDVFSTFSYGSDGYLVLPKLQIEKGKEVALSFDYSLVCPLTLSLTLDVYDGTVNNPANFTKRASMPVISSGEYATKTVTLPIIAPDADEADALTTNYYVAFRTSAPEEGANMKGGYIYTAKLKNISLAYTGVTGITEVGAKNTNVAVIGNTITANAPIAIFDLTGRKVAEAPVINGQASLNVAQLKGVYVVKAGGKAVKVTMK